MLSICDNYALEFHMSFNAQKSKCMVILPSSRRCLKQLLDKCDLKIGGKATEFVSSYSHLGHLLTDDLGDSEDIMKRQGDFIGQVNNVLCFFRQQASAVKYRLFSSYCRRRILLSHSITMQSTHSTVAGC